LCQCPQQERTNEKKEGCGKEKKERKEIKILIERMLDYRNKANFIKLPGNIHSKKE
jgi:hypothetical protein